MKSRVEKKLDSKILSDNMYNILRSGMFLNTKKKGGYDEAGRRD